MVSNGKSKKNYMQKILINVLKTNSHERI